ncbi:type II secretion system protein GspK [uncultured Desulfuromonas sp.]|uniref:general secretion pathway protein GspK n=1 Tax=uncultured Desulfuromonas sp. TaxID=181013 RepID=UPI002AABFC0B|nr:type II secretion system protein GspK [uncultured Desulfuromonas sp.]
MSHSVVPSQGRLCARTTNSFLGALTSSSTGSALVAVLWILLLLSVMALSYARTTRLQARSGLTRTEILRDHYRMAGAFELAHHEYDKYVRNKALLARREEIEELTGKPLALWYPRYAPWLIDVDGASFAVQLCNEAGRFDVSQMTSDQWERVLVACGVEDEELRGAVRDSVTDWSDGDEAHHLQGVESEAYLEKDPPYRSKNHVIQSMAELLLVQGVSRDLYYGSAEHPGLIDFLSVYGHAGKLDINCAAPQTLALAQSLDEEERQAVLAYRQQQRIRNMAELAELVGIDGYSQLQRDFEVVETPDYVTISVSHWPVSTAKPPALWSHRTFKVE